MNKKSKKFLYLGGLLIVIALGFFFLPKRAKIRPVFTLENVKKDNLTTTVTATGTVEPITLVEVGTQVSGVISKIYVDYNSVVKAGQVIAELDKRMLVSEVNSAQATLKSRKAELQQQLRNYNRSKELWEKQAISKVDWEDAQTAYETAQQAVISSEAAVFKAETNLGYATIYATIDGVVVSRAVEEGQTVAASFSTPTLFTIARDLTKMRVIANVDEADIGQVSEGQRVMFGVDAFPNDEFQGQVVQVRLEATTTSNVVTYEVVIDAPNPDLKLKPGLTANVNIYTLEQNDVLVMPAKALRFQPDPQVIAQMEGVVLEEKPATSSTAKIVWVKEDNKVVPKTVAIGVSDMVNVQVLSGLAEGDKVITGVAMANPGAPMVQNAGESSPFMPQRPGRRR